MALIESRVEDGVAALTISHPPLNVLTRALLSELRETLAALAADPTLRVLGLFAAGRDFSAGADVREHLPPDYRDLIPEMALTLAAVVDFPLPVVAAVRGRCLGGGLELVLTADLVVAAETATFGQPEIRLGVTAPFACALLPRRTPRGAAAELLFTGEPISAARAHELGLVQRVVSENDVDSEALELARRLALHSAPALRATKRTMRDAAALPLDVALHAAAGLYVRELMQAEDPIEGLNAFLEKRPPQWKHR